MTGTPVSPVPAPSRCITRRRWPTLGLPSRHATTSAPFQFFHCAPERKVPPDGATVTPPDRQTGVIVLPGSIDGSVIGFDWS